MFSALSAVALLFRGLVVRFHRAPSHITILVRDGTFRLSVSTSSGQTYVLEYKNSLTETDWKPLASVPGDGTVKVLSDPSAPTSQRFYRVRVE